jgi:hypothetical protein
VYTFLTNLTPPELKKLAAVAASAAQAQSAQALAMATDDREKDALTKPMAALMQDAIQARAANNFKKARAILGGIRAAQGDQVDPFVLQQLALATYKSKDPDAYTALEDARTILEELTPKTSTDPETLGLWGAIHKRLHEVAPVAAEKRAALDDAIWAHEKGFYLKNDYYNGINYAFLLNVRAAESAGDEAIADRVQANRVRTRVLSICEGLLANGIKGESERSKAEQEYWVRATVVEALYGLGRLDESAAAFEQAKQMPTPPTQWMIDSTSEQIAKLKALLAATTA